MNQDLIRNLLKLNNESCPEFIYSNPLLDRNITRAVSKSIVKSLYKNDQKEKSNVDSKGNNQSVRKIMLQTIRNTCKSAPEGHTEIDDDLTEILTSFYDKQLTQATSTACENIDKKLDTFLIQNSKAMNLNSGFKSNINPEVLQAMLNLNENVVYTENICKDVIHWDLDDQISKSVVKNLWNEEGQESCFYDNITVRMKSEIESLLLSLIHRLLENCNVDYVALLEESELKSLVTTCSKSAVCFQMCTYILNYLFITFNFNEVVEGFIFNFIQNVKLQAEITISVLYPCNLSHIVTILDLNTDELPTDVKESYVKLTKKYLKSLHLSSEDDLIMLLSHFPIWFNIYFDNNYTSSYICP